MDIFFYYCRKYLGPDDTATDAAYRLALWPIYGSKCCFQQLILHGSNVVPVMYKRAQSILSNYYY